jgi:signal transduction histidine kinase
MATDDLDKLALLIKQQRDAVLARWRQQVRQLPSAQHLDTPTLNDHIPRLLDELAVALQSKSDQTIAEAVNEGSSPKHGIQRVQDNFDIEEVIAEYNILRGCLHDLAEENGLGLRGDAFHIMNRVFDRAISLALQAYTTQRALEVQQRRAEYLAFVAHDLRTPLNAISLAGRVLEMIFPESARNLDAMRMFKALRRSVSQLETLVGKVLEENTNLETEMGVQLQRREFDLWPLVEGLIHDLHPVAGTASTSLINQVADDLVVYADAGVLRRIFQNLLANAIKYTPRGEIIIGASERPELGIIECWVSDNGTGIAAELLGKIFEKGETDQQNGGGKGLGLAIVAMFTEAHGGHVSVESKEGAGSTFRFSLPTKAAVEAAQTSTDQ